MTYSVKLKRKCKYNAGKLATLSICIFIILYFLPITILIPEIIRKPLLLIGFGVFALALLLISISYFFSYVSAVTFLILYYFSSWSSWIDFTSYIFPMLISVESLFLSFAIADKKIVISKSVINFMIIITGITASTTSLALLSFPMAVRELGMGASDEILPTLMMYRKYNIAGWGLLFAMAFLEGSILYLYKIKHKKYLLAIAIVNAICVVLSQLAFAILIAASSSLFVYFNGENKKITRNVLLLFMIFLIIWFNREQILLYLYQLLGINTNLAKLQLRVQNLYNLLVLGIKEGDSEARFELYQKSFDAFIKHPFGLFIEGIYGMNLLGYHSEFFDFIGAMGFLGLVVILVMISKLIINIKKINTAYSRRFLAIMYITFFTMFFVNPILSHPHIWMSTLLFPSLIVFQSQDEEKSVVPCKVQLYQKFIKKGAINSTVA